MCVKMQLVGLLLTLLVSCSLVTGRRSKSNIYNDVIHPNDIMAPDEHDVEHRSANNEDKPKTNPQHQQQQCGCSVVTGPPGASGMPGVPGMHGMRGHDGQRGDKGEIGPKGDTGPIGPAGLLGPVGSPGQKGDRGQNGVQGPEGQPGAAGEKGEKGNRGFSGFAGFKGQKGEPSDRSRVRMAFSVARSQKLGPVLQDTPVTFDVVYANFGEAFDVYSSHFVCRVNGTYLFAAHVLGQNGRDVYAWLMMNDRHRAPLHGDGRAGYGGGSQTIILPLKRDDHVWIQLNKDSALLNDYTTFSGHLLFED